MSRRKEKTNKSRGRNYKKDSAENNSSKSTTEKEKVTDADSVAKEGTNDPEWYARDAQLLIDAASLNHAYATGSEVVLNSEMGDNYTYGSNFDQPTSQGVISGGSVDGIATFKVRPTLGFNSDATDPLNLATVALYTQVRYANSGRKNYDAPDLMLYALALSELYSFSFWCRKLYSLAFMYSQANKYIGDALIEANNVDPNDLRNNLAQFRYWLNTFINRVTQYALPSSLLLLSQRVYMYAGLYIDGENTIKEQLYQWAPVGFYQFAINDGNTAGMAQSGMLQMKYLKDEDKTPLFNGYSSNNEVLMTVQELMSFGESLLGAMFGDEDFVIMSGDILKAFEGQLISMGSQPEEGGILPVYDHMVLSQMKNATIVGPCNRYKNGSAVGTYKGMTTFVSPGVPSSLTFWPDHVIQVANASGQPLLVSGDVLDSNFVAGPSDYPCESNTRLFGVGLQKVLTGINFDPASIIEATRLSCAVKPDKAGAISADPQATGRALMALTVNSGTYIIERAKIAKFQLYQGSWVARSYCIMSSVLEEILDSSSNEWELDGWDYTSFKRVQQFDHFPTLYFLRYDTGSKAVVSTGVATHIDEYSILTAEMLDRMHTVALLSLLFVPGVAKFVNTAVK